MKYKIDEHIYYPSMNETLEEIEAHMISLKLKEQEEIAAWKI